MAYRVKEVASMVGVSVRTLHYYDQIGLLKSASISPAGYRLYTEPDLERLQQIMFFKEIGFDLQEIKNILDSPGFDRKQALKAHKDILLEKRMRLEEIINLVDRTIDTIEGGTSMDKKSMFDAFDMTDIEKHREKYAEEARQLYGDKIMDETEARTANYNRNDWAGIQARWDEIYRQIATAMDKGPADPQVQALIGEYRQHITDHFYDCTLEIFRGLGDLYVSDERFTANIDKYQPGLAAFLKAAIHYYCDCHENE